MLTDEAEDSTHFNYLAAVTYGKYFDSVIILY